MITVLIVDDEEPARYRLLDLLDKVPEVTEVQQARNGLEAVAAIRASPPAIVFLDVQMPGMDGLSVVETIGIETMPIVVFVTAHDDHALRAFELSALDYLLKPFDDERFHRVLARALEQHRLHTLGGMKHQLNSLIDHMRPSGQSCRIAVKKRGCVHLLSPEEIDYIAGEGPYVRIHAHGESYLLRERMNSLEDKLDAHQFFRIHRSTLVNLERVAGMVPFLHGDYRVRLSCGTELKLSRSRRDLFRKRLGVSVETLTG